MMTPRANRLKAMANAYATARAVACNPDMGARVLERTLNKAGFKIVRIKKAERPAYEAQTQERSHG